MKKATEDKIRKKNRDIWLAKQKLKKENPDGYLINKIKSLERELKQNNPEEYEILRAYKKKRKQRLYQFKFNRRSAEDRRNYNLVAKYHISVSEFKRLLESQDGKCAICGKSSDVIARAFSVDHDHKCCPGKKTCGKCIRGLLCERCNSGLGAFKDDPLLLEKAVAYLRSSTSTE
jgi:hypothetical protein